MDGSRVALGRAALMEFMVIRWFGPIAVGALVLLSGGVARAQAYLPNPLEVETPDPLLPQPTVERELSPLEQSQLRQSLDELDRQAAAELAAGDPDAAFATWYRELRLRQSLGPVEEVQALGRVGGIAWEEGRSQEVRDILERLENVQQAAEYPNDPEPDPETPPAELDPELLTALGEAYQQLRAPSPAIAIYEQQLELARAEGDTEREVTLLEAIGTLHLARFDYKPAAATFEELLDLARARGDNFAQVNYLQTLAGIYERDARPESGVRVREQLLQTYRDRGEATILPPLLLALGQDYEGADRPQDASEAYRESFELAWAQERYALAGEALEALAELYEANNRPETAVQLYAELLKVKQQSYDFIGLMGVYDAIARVYESQENYTGALEAYQRGLELAEALQHDEAYFRERIESVSAQLGS